MFRPYETTIINLRVPEVYTTGNHTAVTAKPMAEISSLYEIFIKFAFGEHYYNIKNVL
jgi:hypothetical protein